MKTENYYFYSKTTNSFYPVSLKPDYDKSNSWPGDAKEVTEEIFTEYSGTPPVGKMRGSDKKGMPTWVDVPPLTHAQLVAQAKEKRQRLLDNAAQQILLMQNVCNPMANPNVTDEDKQLLLDWQKYQVAVYQINPDDAPDIEWPLSPTQIKI